MSNYKITTMPQRLKYLSTKIKLTEIDNRQKINPIQQTDSPKNLTPSLTFFAVFLPHQQGTGNGGHPSEG